ncbi:beta-galactosidase [Fictibacillus macauensis ZFHKF-1]|uniref:Beta-galactosidase n=1 Tax=Fictibacillus macauensis ZFHKF-1 TaxID=1196324 RepID=I8UAR5_9BACL|nr:beta-galactosidase [Fictibacillus macauensis]EIT83898.1 beta-galactosidase [Fictibacillus macauensis ZFHKF-1]
MYIGVDYYPEQWPKERWQEDVSLMKELGVNVVRLAEFGWQLMEPKEGVYDFSLFDEVIDLMSQHDIKVVLGTPTATPPAWMIHNYPDILPVDEEGVTISFGGRRHYSVNSKRYRAFSVKIVEQLAKHYGRNETVIGWQTDNEYGHEKSDRSYGEQDRVAFHEWLKDKYETLEHVNEAWGTAFWSQTYTEWEQIPAPKKVLQEHNPGLLLDWDRFCSDQYTSYNKEQCDVLRHHISEDQFITHNFVFNEQAIKQRDMTKDLDFVSYDNYPVWGGLAEPIPPAAIAQQHDLCRATKDGKGYWVMEELAGAQGWSQIGYLPRPGHIKLWTYQAIARGAEAIVYFRWRAARYGTEQFCHGILDHDGKPRRKFEEVKEVFLELKEMGDDWIASHYEPEVGVYYDVENAWAWKIQPQSSALRYKEELVRFYNGAYRLNAATTIVHPESSLEGLKTIIVPLYFLNNSSFTSKLKEYVNDGGTVVLTYRSGVKNEDNAVTDRTLPGELAELAGIEVHEYEPLQEGQQHRVVGTAGHIADVMSPATVWCDLIETTTAEVIAKYRDAFYEGTPAITKNKYGKGFVYYIGTAVEDYYLARLYRDVFRESNVKTYDMPEDVEIIIRKKENGKRYLCVLNHSTTASHRITLPKGIWKDAISGEKFQGDVRMPSLGATLLIER